MKSFILVASIFTSLPIVALTQENYCVDVVVSLPRSPLDFGIGYNIFIDGRKASETKNLESFSYSAKLSAKPTEICNRNLLGKCSPARATLDLISCGKYQYQCTGGAFSMTCELDKYIPAMSKDPIKDTVPDVSYILLSDQLVEKQILSFPISVGYGVVEKWERTFQRKRAIEVVDTFGAAANAGLSLGPLTGAITISASQSLGIEFEESVSFTQGVELDGAACNEYIVNVSETRKVGEALLLGIERPIDFTYIDGVRISAKPTCHE